MWKKYVYSVPILALIIAILLITIGYMMMPSWIIDIKTNLSTKIMITTLNGIPLYQSEINSSTRINMTHIEGFKIYIYNLDLKKSLIEVEMQRTVNKKKAIFKEERIVDNDPWEILVN